MLMNREGYIWLNDQFVDWKDAKIHCLTHTFHYGLGVLEGIRVYATDKGPAIFRLRDHINRLFQSARILHLPIDYSKEKLETAQKELISKNNLKSAYIRPMIFYGAEYLGLHTDKLSSNVMLAAWDWGAYLGSDSLEKGIKVHISSLTRHYTHRFLYKAKANAHYMNSIFALHEAKMNGCHEALFLDDQGYVAEGGGENIFIVKNEILYTPKLTYILEGITRKTIFVLAADCGLTVEEKNITLYDIYTADEVFFTGTAVEVTPICMIDSKIIGHGQRGPITQHLQKIYLNQVKGKNKNHEEWLTFIE
ncbi:MAG: branched chain amino acid aminotransferase [Legionellales bacterium RIFCSPHIGHO2_12_FULL_37_14]|nr:MAG: branched chain amino acid aminotransferase [Legionellales bacterium RIFCSPHIGHO2_12_FULL_37_14]